MKRILRRPGAKLFFLLAILGLADSASAQIGPSIFRGMTLTARYDYFDPSVRHQAVAEGSQMRHFGLVNPKAPLTYMSSFNWALGARFNTRQDSTSFIWRINLVDAEMKRKLLAFGFTIVDLDRTGPMERNYRWVNGRVGPGIMLGGRKFSIGAKAMGTIGAHSIILGRDNYGVLGQTADSTISGLEAGYRITVPMRIGGRILLHGEYSDRVLVKSPEPRFKTLSGGLRIAFGTLEGPKFLLLASYRQEELSFNNSDLKIDNNYFQLGIRFVPAPPKRRSQFDEEF